VPLGICAEKFTETLLVNHARSQFEHGLCRRLLAGCEAVSVQLEKQHSNDEASALVVINEGVVPDDAGRIEGSELDDVWIRIGDVVGRPGKRRLEQRLVPHTLGSAMLDEQPVMDRQNKVILDPDWLTHLASTWSVF